VTRCPAARQKRLISRPLRAGGSACSGCNYATRRLARRQPAKSTGPAEEVLQRPQQLRLSKLAQSHAFAGMLGCEPAACGGWAQLHECHAYTHRKWTGRSRGCGRASTSPLATRTVDAVRVASRCSGGLLGASQAVGGPRPRFDQ
jgi:hypothetical protein